MREQEPEHTWKGKSFPYKGYSMRRKGVEEKEMEEQKEEESMIGSGTFLQRLQSSQEPTPSILLHTTLDSIHETLEFVLTFKSS